MPAVQTSAADGSTVWVVLLGPEGRRSRWIRAFACILARRTCSRAACRGHFPAIRSCPGIRACWSCESRIRRRFSSKMNTDGSVYGPFPCREPREVACGLGNVPRQSRTCYRCGTPTGSGLEATSEGHILLYVRLTAAAREELCCSLDSNRRLSFCEFGGTLKHGGQA